MMQWIPATSTQCMQQYPGSEAIDYFFAREMTALTGADDPLLFHLWLALQWSARQGHSCLRLDAISDRALWKDEMAGSSGFHFPVVDQLTGALKRLDLSAQADQPVVLEGLRLYLRRFWSLECELAEMIETRLQPRSLSSSQVAGAGRLLQNLFPQMMAASSEDQSPDWQALAVANALNRPFCVISGGPGTGKTHTVTRLLLLHQLLAKGGLRIAMAAPTGKAKQRLQESVARAKSELAEVRMEPGLLESIPELAHTLHALLGIHPLTSHCRFNPQNPLPVDLLLVDEASMIDLSMMVRVLRALPADAGLILVGDASQLPSIAVGSVLSDLVPVDHPGYSPEVVRQVGRLTGQSLAASSQTTRLSDSVCMLYQSHRFDGEGGIGQLAREVISLQSEAGWQRLLAAEGSGQLEYLQSDAWDDWLDSLIDSHYLPLLGEREISRAFNRLAEFRLLLPMRVGRRGVDELNLEIEQRLARRLSWVRPGQHYPGRPVMVTHNRPALGLYNGDIGLIQGDQQGRLQACFETPGGMRRVALGLLTECEPVYAMTIHKTQGSEFRRVAIGIPDEAGRLLSPELLYTAITRAREHCAICCSKAAWQQAMEHRVTRWSGLGQRIDP